MKHGKKPTRAQKVRLGKAGLSPESWHIVKNKPNGELVILHNALHNLYISVMERYTQVQLNEPVEQIVSRWKNAYLPSYLPEGCLMSDADNSGEMIFIEYTDASDNRITFYQYGTDSSIRLDTEGASEAQPCQIGDMVGQLYEKEGRSALYWSNGEQSFSIEFTSNIRQDEIIKMAESMEQ